MSSFEHSFPFYYLKDFQSEVTDTAYSIVVSVQWEPKNRGFLSSSFDHKIKNRELDMGSCSKLCIKK